VTLPIYPHEGVEAIRQLPGYPHHFQRRASDGAWIFEESSMRGDVEREIGLVLDFLKSNLKQPPFA
jgi:hypothetical protein